MNTLHMYLIKLQQLIWQARQNPGQCAVYTNYQDQCKTKQEELVPLRAKKVPLIFIPIGNLKRITTAHTDSMRVSVRDVFHCFTYKASVFIWRDFKGLFFFVMTFVYWISTLFSLSGRTLFSPTYYNRNHKMNRLISLLKMKTEKRKNSRVRQLNQPKFPSELAQIFPACRYSWRLFKWIMISQNEELRSSRIAISIHLWISYRPEEQA